MYYHSCSDAATLHGRSTLVFHLKNMRQSHRCDQVAADVKARELINIRYAAVRGLAVVVPWSLSGQRTVLVFAHPLSRLAPRGTTPADTQTPPHL